MFRVIDPKGHIPYDLHIVWQSLILKKLLTFSVTHLILAELSPLSWLEVIQITWWLLIKNQEQLGAFPLSANQGMTTPII